MRYAREPLAVACPTCGEGVSKMCVSVQVECRARGNELIRCHQARFHALRMAIVASLLAMGARGDGAGQPPVSIACVRCGSDTHARCCLHCCHAIRKRDHKASPDFCSLSCERAHALAAAPRRV